jgi:acetyl-CoA carboxylase biotin carboxyl carrier protein
MTSSKQPSQRAASTPQAPAAKAQAAGASPDSAPGLALSFQDLQTLISLVGREPIEEFEFESLGTRFHIRKRSSAPAAIIPVAPTAILPVTPMPSQTVVATAQPATEQTDDPGIHHITSPIVGTFYRAPSASAAPFVQPGDFVKPGQTLCIVEAMKLMNEIECDVAGEVVAVLVENGQPVEYGERLFAIRVR